MDKEIRYPAEWGQQSATIIAWPDDKTDWSGNLREVLSCYKTIIAAITKHQAIIIICRDEKKVAAKLQQAVSQKIHLLEIPFNDTWMRDCGPITIFKNEVPVMLDFRFNGWGLKYPAHLDNQINRKMHKSGIFNIGVSLVKRKDFVLEGGSLDTDGNGTLLAMERCLLSVNRNEHLSKMEMGEELKQTFGAEKVIWLKHGYLEGDDTDGHIDMLVRFCNEQSIMYATCDDGDTHKPELKKMEMELKQLTNRNGRPYHLIPVPLPAPVLNHAGNRLPATYLNFLFVNKAVLVPVYENRMDAEALKLFGHVFKDREVVPVNCMPLLHQGGSLHCATMQLPDGCV